MSTRMKGRIDAPIGVRRLLRRSAPLLLVFTLTSCALLPKRTGATGFAVKEIAGKRPANRLVAGDGTSCTVSSSVYRTKQIGDSIACFWVGSDL